MTAQDSLAAPDFVKISLEGVGARMAKILGVKQPVVPLVYSANPYKELKFEGERSAQYPMAWMKIRGIKAADGYDPRKQGRHPSFIGRRTSDGHFRSLSTLQVELSVEVTLVSNDPQAILKTSMDFLKIQHVRSANFISSFGIKTGGAYVTVQVYAEPAEYQIEEREYSEALVEYSTAAMLRVLTHVALNDMYEIVSMLDLMDGQNVSVDTAGEDRSDLGQTSPVRLRMESTNIRFLGDDL